MVHRIVLLPLALQPAVGFGLSNNPSPFVPIYHQLSLHLLTHNTWRSLSTSSLHPFLGLPLRLVSSSSWVKIFLGILSSSIHSRWPSQLILCPFIHFTIFPPLFNFSSSLFVLLFHSTSSYLERYILLNILFGLSNNTSPFFPIYHQLSPTSHSHHLKISFQFFSPSFPGSSPSSRPFQFLGEDLFVHPILLHSLQVTQPAYYLPLYPFYYIFSFTQLF